MQSDLYNFKQYQAGRASACDDMLVEGFDILKALKSFEEDPADSPY